MRLTIISPYEKKECTVTWLDITTPEGNFVIQQGHAPMIVTIIPHKPIIMLLTNGKQETITPSASGILEINRDKALLLFNA